MDGQTAFDGFEIQTDEMMIPGLGKVAVGRVRRDLDVHLEDAIDITVRVYVDRVQYGGKGDGRGNRKDQFGRRFYCSLDEDRWEVVGYTRHDERDRDWRIEHGATA